jgi:hypothetical protein
LVTFLEEFDLLGESIRTTTHDLLHGFLVLLEVILGSLLPGGELLVKLSNLANFKQKLLSNSDSISLTLASQFEDGFVFSFVFFFLLLYELQHVDLLDIHVQSVRCGLEGVFGAS